MKDHSKQVFLSLLLSFVSFTMSYAQNQNLAQVQEDSTINVISYFCKNDTMDYRMESVKQKIQGNDTTLRHYIKEDFRLIVRDSTSNGYKLEYSSLGNYEMEGDEVDVVSKAAFEKLAELSSRQHVIFTIDELGNLQHIENWRDIKKTMQDGIQILCDSLYANNPMLDSVMPRNRFETSLNLQYSTEQSLWNAYEELQLLFGIHGKAFTIGRHETKDDSGYPSVTNLVVSYGSYDDEDQIEGDYYIAAKTTQTIPAEDVVTLVKGQLSGLLSDEAVKTMQEVDLKNQLEDAQSTLLEAYFLFFNGWPCDMTKQNVMKMNGAEHITTKHIEWLSRHWQLVDSNETEQEKI